MTTATDEYGAAADQLRAAPDDPSARARWEAAKAALDADIAMRDRRAALADQIATLFGWTPYHGDTERERALFVLWREWADLAGTPTEHPALTDEKIAELARLR